MSEHRLVIATRESPLALWQAEYVKSRLEAAHAGLQVELLGMTTRGDVLLETPLAKVGGKGLFVKELERAMLEGRADLAVHSMKDVPVAFPEGLGLTVICPREDPRDAFVSNRFETLMDLPDGAVVGTCSLRRQAQLRGLRPDLQIRDLRGNVNSRLRKLDAGDFDAIILASAGLKRLAMPERIRQAIAPEVSLPAVGQGAVGIECRLDDTRTIELLQALADEPTTIRVRAERALNARLNGGCQVPIAGYAVLAQGEVWLRGLVGSPDGGTLLRAEQRGPATDPEGVGIAVADALLAQGAGDLLAALHE